MSNNRLKDKPTKICKQNRISRNKNRKHYWTHTTKMNLKNSVEGKETDSKGYDCLGTVESSWLGKYLRERAFGVMEMFFFCIFMFYVLNGVLLKQMHTFITIHWPIYLLYFIICNLYLKKVDFKKRERDPRLEKNIQIMDKEDTREIKEKSKLVIKW